MSNDGTKRCSGLKIALPFFPTTLLMIISLASPLLYSFSFFCFYILILMIMHCIHKHMMILIYSIVKKISIKSVIALHNNYSIHPLSLFYLCLFLENEPLKNKYKSVKKREMWMREILSWWGDFGKNKKYKTNSNPTAMPWNLSFELGENGWRYARK